ncbi:MAG: hypothetical protein OHK0029_21010 [Armatimonadaceae bacterium]
MTVTNRWGDVPLQRVPAEHFSVFRGVPGAAYHHHAQVICHQNRLLATFSSGERDEDQTGQRMMLCVSDDWGESWSDPVPLRDRMPGFGVVTSEGIFAAGDLLIAYAGCYDTTDHGMLMYYAMGGKARAGSPGEPPWHAHTRTEIYTSTDGGNSWQGPVETIPGLVPNLSPFRLPSGRLLLPGNVTFWYTDDTQGIRGWQFAGLPGLTADFVDDPEGVHRAGHLRGDTTFPCEASGYCLPDGTIRILLRTNQFRLACTESRDNGVTWSEPTLTDYTDAGSRCHFGQLPDGRYFGLSNPAPRSVRTPLVLALSENGTTFDRHFVLGDDPHRLFRIPGLHKYGMYGYPFLCTTQDTAFAIYSTNKEDISLCRFPLSALH